MTVPVQPSTSDSGSMREDPIEPTVMPESAPPMEAAPVPDSKEAP